VTLYAIFLAIWATLFLENWKRYNNRLAFNWGMLDWETMETERPGFKGELKLGTYHEGEWVEFQESDQEKYEFDLPRTRYSQLTSKWAKSVSVGVPITGMMAFSVIIATIAILSFRLFVQKREAPMVGSIVGGVLNAIMIIVTNLIWNRVAVWLTEFENHRTITEFEDSLIWKIFIFQFVNTYTSLYYIAFFKKETTFWGKQDAQGSFVDTCKMGDPTRQGFGWGCIDELTLQLACLLLTNMFIGQMAEVLVPWFIARFGFNLPCMVKKEETKDLPEWEKQNKLQIFEGTIDEYTEMIIQYGEINLFAAAFPVAPLLAVLNNMIEIRTDAYKLVSSFNRPLYRGAKDIGTWYDILEFLGYIAVITNCFLIGFGMSSIYNLLYDPDHDYRGQFYALGFIVGLEHLIFIIKFLIAILVPDMPGDVKKALAKQNFIQKATEQKQEGIGMKLEWKDENWVDAEGEESDEEEFIVEKKKTRREKKKSRKESKAEAEQEIKTETV
jgi:hypothetical protein